MARRKRKVQKRILESIRKDRRRQYKRSVYDLYNEKVRSTKKRREVERRITQEQEHEKRKEIQEKVPKMLQNKLLGTTLVKLMSRARSRLDCKARKERRQVLFAKNKFGYGTKDRYKLHSIKRC